MSKKAVVTLTVGLALVIASCGGSDGPQIGDPWARTSASMQDTGVVYMTITGGAEVDRLVGVGVDSSIAANAELHETVMSTSDDGTEMMMMEPIESLAVGPSEEVKLLPGGYHIMLVKLVNPLVDGSTFDLTLSFENAGDIVVQVQVRDG